MTEGKYRITAPLESTRPNTILDADGCVIASFDWFTGTDDETEQHILSLLNAEPLAQSDELPPPFEYKMEDGDHVITNGRTMYRHTSKVCLIQRFLADVNKHIAETHADGQTIDQIRDLVWDVKDDRPHKEGEWGFRNTLMGKIKKLVQVYKNSQEPDEI